MGQSLFLYALGLTLSGGGGVRRSLVELGIVGGEWPLFLDPITLALGYSL